MLSGRRLPKAALAITFLLASMAFEARNPPDIATPDARPAAPDFTLSGAKGTRVRFSDYKGKVVLLDFWATWCIDCRMEIPWYIEFGNRYRSRGLEVVGVSMDGNWDAVKPFVDQQKINYTVVMGSTEMTSLYSVKFLPRTVLIDRDGKIADTCVGVVNKGIFESEILALLRERSKNNSK